MEMSEADPGDEYEYEYEDNETEVFFVDIDLSSLNPPIKSKQPLTPAKRKADGSPTRTPDYEEARLDSADEPADAAHATRLQEPQQTPARMTENDQGAPLHFPSRVQILDLSSVNPIVSYQGQVFGCTWADMVGTNMFFTQPGMSDDAETLRSTADYDLFGTSRIKLVGHRAKMTKKSAEESGLNGESADQQPVESQDAEDPRDQAREKQISFLEKLKEIKRQRREADVVQTSLNQGMVTADQDRTPESSEAQA
ncbi:hypothetical protein H2200_002056 [Cladophialophora chaetospira]|uniref:Transcription factor TFIIIC triple barrel domain-containing protein n=1 Tax=Cladophialophora chaetospira TaxID=386627 RepID=A0AA38XI62_9EURO|nr:hypothetical protein H2200_002056 [Cladophialophora chaetospira]